MNIPPIKKITEQSLTEAADLIRRGELVAFPTETVYGLAANACSDEAVAKIFAAKGRPTFNPLIVHVTNVGEAQTHTVFNDSADKLAAMFWPGALSFVLPKQSKSNVSALVTAGLDTMAIRNPAHPAALELLNQVQTPIAAPSANRSGCLSPTTAKHVAEHFGSRVSLILDGGECGVGVESTILDLSSKAPVLLRPGGVTVEEFESVIGSLNQRPVGKILAPGMLENHYAPKTPIRINAHNCGSNEAVLAYGSQPLTGGRFMENLSAEENLIEAAGNLFRMLHILDKRNCSQIAVMPIPNEGLGLAINDRLKRASTQT